MRALLLCVLLRALASSRVVSKSHHYSSLLESFIGKFINSEQAAQALLEEKPSAAQGGHELVSVSIARHPSATDVLVAAYSLGAFEDKAPPFRFRYYEFSPSSAEAAGEEECGVVARMRLHRPLPQTELKLKEHSYDVSRYLPDLSTGFEHLQHCDVQWTHVGQSLSDCAAAYYHGTLVEGQCTVCSQADPSVRLLVRDDLRVFEDGLWICDRAYTSSGRQVIGHPDGVPYKLKKCR